jgi:hypothetical protein
MSNLAGGCIMCTAGPGGNCDQACPNRTARPRPAALEHAPHLPKGAAAGERCELTDLLVDQCHHCRYAPRPAPDSGE